MVYIPINYDKDFGGKVAIVTGGASGIGKSIVEGLAYHGAISCILDLNEERGRNARQEINYPHLNSPKGRVEFYRTDVSKKGEVKKTIDKIVQKHGEPWILVNNAGIEINKQNPSKPEGEMYNLITMPYEDMKKIIDVNFFGYINMLREVIPHMEKNGGGRIVNVSSVQARKSCRPITSYQPTKLAILGLGRLAMEYGRNDFKKK